jgi:mono/diheme cytochrome c family protein
MSGVKRTPAFITNTYVLVVTFIGLSGVLPIGPAGQAAGEESSASASAKRGDTLFNRRCVSCHNKQPGDTSPFGPPNLYDLIRNKKLTAAQAARIIHGGKGQMPSFGKTISDDQIKDIIAYLKTRWDVQ